MRLLLAILAFLVIYPGLMLLLGALTDTNPVIDGFGVFRLSVDNFATVLTNPNVGEALVNTLIACGGGTLIAVVIGLGFSWIVVRTNTPGKRFIAAASMLPLFAPPLVAGVAWVILGSPKTGLINTMFKWAGLDWRVDFYSLTGLVFVFGIYYAPYVYMFTASALRNMDPSLEEAAEVSGASAFSTLFTVTFPLIMPAIISGMLLSFIVMLGIYGIPAVLGWPANLNVLTTYIFKLTNWSPPLYNTAAAVAIILMVVTGLLVYAQQRIMSGRSYTTVAGKAFRPRSLDLGAWRWPVFGLAVAYIFVVVVLPLAALIVAAFRKFMFIRDAASLFEMRMYSLVHFHSIFDNPLTLRSIYNAVEVGIITALAGGVLAFAMGYTIYRTRVPGRRTIDLLSTLPVAIPGMTALYVTHDQAEAVVIGDRIGVMRDGKLLQMGTPDQIYNRPADLFVANFTGATNELAGKLLSRDEQFGIIDLGEGKRVEAALVHTLAVGDAVRIALRPENITIGKQNGANAFHARVVDRRYQGTQTTYDIDLFGRRLEVLELGTATRHVVGEDVPVSLPREGCWAYRDTEPVASD